MGSIKDLEDLLHIDEVAHIEMKDAYDLYMGAKMKYNESRLLLVKELIRLGFEDFLTPNIPKMRQATTRRRK